MEMKTWKYYSPTYECDKYNLEMLKYSPWSGHRAFAYDFVCNWMPSCIVELGSYYGCSAFSFLQAIKDQKLNSCFYGIDTWMGDSFTEEDYKENIYYSYKNIQDSCFGKLNAYMIRKTFDEAIGSFEDSSIDLLHIDGSHTYEDVKHDFETWKNKVKPDGVIFFHDIGEDLLYGKKMGSHIFWEEIKETYHTHFEFPFSFGLGILFLSEAHYQWFIKTVDIKYYQQKINFQDVENKDTLRKKYFVIRDTEKVRQSLVDQLRIQQSHLDSYKQVTEEKNQYIVELEMKIKELSDLCEQTFSEMKRVVQIHENEKKDILENIDAKESYIQELQYTIKKYQENDAKKDQYILEMENDKVRLKQNSQKEKEDQKKEYTDNIKKYQNTISGKDAYIAELNDTIEKYSRDNKEKEKYIESFQQLISGKDAYIDELCGNIESFKQLVDGKDAYIDELHRNIESFEIMVGSKESYIKELRDDIGEFQKNTDGKDLYIQELLHYINEFKDNLSGKDQYICELLDTIEKYRQTVEGKDAYIKELEERLRIV